MRIPTEKSLDEFFRQEIAKQKEDICLLIGTSAPLTSNQPEKIISKIRSPLMGESTTHAFGMDVLDFAELVLEANENVT